MGDGVDAVSESNITVSKCILKFVQFPEFIQEDKADGLFSSDRSTALSRV